MGGSVAAACKKYAVSDHISVFDIHKIGNYDESNYDVGNSIADCIRNSELIIIATPVLQIENTLLELAKHLTGQQIITDLGSTKVNVINAAKHLKEFEPQFVPGHPIAGFHKTGHQHANSDLFLQARVILTPTEKTNRNIIERVKQFWQKLECKVNIMSAAEHDQLLAKISHAPHVLASAVINSVDENTLSYAGPGFKDFTRIGETNPKIWRDICIANRKEILQYILEFEQILDQFKAALATADADQFEHLFQQSKQKREKLS